MRGTVSTWSEASRRRFRYAIARLDWSKLPAPLDITLTYPGEWQRFAPDGKACKRHLELFLKRWATFAGSRQPVVWKLEFQGRGAPHFHVIASLPPGRSLEAARVVVGAMWFQIVGSGDPAHRAAGTRVAKVRSSGGFGAYLAGYLNGQKAAQEQPPDGFQPGRWWNVPTALMHPWDEGPQLEPERTVRVRRTMNRLIRSRKPGFKPRPGGATVLSRAEAGRTYAQLLGYDPDGSTATAGGGPPSGL